MKKLKQHSQILVVLSGVKSTKQFVKFTGPYPVELESVKFIEAYPMGLEIVPDSVDRYY